MKTSTTKKNHSFVLFISLNINIDLGLVKYGPRTETDLPK